MMKRIFTLITSIVLATRPTGCPLLCAAEPEDLPTPAAWCDRNGTA